MCQLRPLSVTRHHTSFLREELRRQGPRRVHLPRRPVVLVHYPAFRLVVLPLLRLPVGELEPEEDREPPVRRGVPGVLRGHAVVVLAGALLLRVLVGYLQVGPVGRKVPLEEFRLPHQHRQSLLEQYLVPAAQPRVEAPGLVPRVPVPPELRRVRPLRLTHPVSVHRQVALRRVLPLRLHL